MNNDRLSDNSCTFTLLIHGANVGFIQLGNKLSCKMHILTLKVMKARLHIRSYIASDALGNDTYQIVRFNRILSKAIN